MTVSTRVDADASLAIIHIQGRFDFSMHQAFRDAYKDMNTVRNVVVDLTKVDYMDSAALGMLLLLREHLQSNSGSITLRRPTGDVRRVLDIANFSRLFKFD